MITHEIFAMIDEDGIIQNICVADNYEEVNRVARAVYGDNAIAVDCQQYLCQIGDKYINGIFYKADGVTIIPYIPTQEQQIAQLQKENQELILAMAELVGGGGSHA